MIRAQLRLRSRRGATLAVVAVSLVALLAIMALAIDLGMMYSARNEAQRVADAAALAGASAFLDHHPATAAQVPARNRAKEYVMANYVMSTYMDTTESQIDVDLGNQRVTVQVRRQQIPTWFARIFGVNDVAVTAVATAQAVDAGGAKCVMPWAVQDLWLEAGERRPGPEDRYQPDPNNPDPQSCQGNGADCYRPAEQSPDPHASGYGRTPSDNGMPIELKYQKPAGPNSNELAQPGPGVFMIWQMPEDPTLPACAQGGQTSTKPYIYQNSICACNKNTIELGKEYPLEYGNVVGPTFSGLDALMPDNPARWDDFPDGPPASHPQVVKIALMPPLPPPPGNHWNASNLPNVTFSNFALVFIEALECGGKKCNAGADEIKITGRFLYSAAGEEGGETTGALVKYLRLVR